jgi:phage protein D
LVFIFGYQGQEQSSQKTAIITDIDTNYGLDISVNIKAVDKGNFMKKATDTKVWEEVTAAQIAKEIADLYDLDSEIVETKKSYETLPQGNLNDFDFLKKLADENNRHFHISNNRLFFTQRKLADKSVVTYTYRNGDSKIKSFKPKSKGIKDNGVGAGQKVTKINTDTNEIIEVKSDPNKVDGNTSLGKINNYYDANGSQFMKKGNGTVATNPSNDPEVIKKQTQKNVAEAQLSNLEATLVLEGEPSLDEGSIITIAGVAQKHVGNYYVVSVRHSISGSGFETVCELKKNATNRPLGNNTATQTTVNNTTGTKTVNDKTEVKTVSYTQNGTRK